MYSLLKKIVCCPGVSGREGTAADVIEGVMAPVSDSVRRDAMGNLICLVGGNAPEGSRRRIMLCAHMDEIGFMVTFIEKDGRLRVATMGGINLCAAAYSRVLFPNGTEGVIVPDAGVKPADFAAEKFSVDIGAYTAEEAGARVKIGDTCALRQELRKLGAHQVAGRPLDDRIGCAVIADVARRLSLKRAADDVYFVFSVQEEVGLRGAGTAAYGIMPDLAIAVDVTGTGDVPGAVPMEVSLGKGAAVKLRDGSVICDPDLVSDLLAVAAENGIPAQREVLVRGGTDTQSIQLTGAGCTAGAVSVPSRYIHSGTETADLRDAAACSDLLFAYLTAERPGRA
jgi:endoglucanase